MSSLVYLKRKKRRVFLPPRVHEAVVLDTQGAENGCLRRLSLGALLRRRQSSSIPCLLLCF